MHFSLFLLRLPWLWPLTNPAGKNEGRLTRKKTASLKNNPNKLFLKMESVFQRLKLLRRLYNAAKEVREVHVPQTMPQPSHGGRRISRYGWMGTTDMCYDLFLDNFTSGSCSSASRSGLLKLPINNNIGKCLGNL